MDMAIPVTLIVKAPNQQFEDQTIQCELTWTIKRLKGYLSEVYPCKPSTDEQKLIYSGQLLGDSVVLKDVLRQYEGQETHTVHLVYTPKNRNFYTTPMTSKKPEAKVPSKSSQSTTVNGSTTSPSNVNGDGLRHRNAPASSTTTTTTATINVGQPLSQNPQINASFMGGIYPQHAAMPGVPFVPMPPQLYEQSAMSGQQQINPQEYLVAQQIAMQNMMHQMYMQYVNHYASQSGGQYNYPSMPYFPQNVSGNYVTNMSQPMPQFQNVTESTPPIVVGGGAGDAVGAGNVVGGVQDANGPVAGAAAAAAAAAAQQPLFQRPVQIDDENENRDWLEIFYTFSRLIVLLSLVYFYSSPIRCSIVIFVMILYYLYHTNQRNIRERQLRAAAAIELLQRELNREAPENPVENDETTEVVTPNVDETTEAGDSNENGAPLSDADIQSTASTPDTIDGGEVSTASSTDSIDQDDPNRLPTIALLRTFVLSFFASLIPETPAV